MSWRPLLLRIIAWYRSSLAGGCHHGPGRRVEVCVVIFLHYCIGPMSDRGHAHTGESLSHRFVVCAQVPSIGCMSCHPIITCALLRGNVKMK